MSGQDSVAAATSARSPRELPVRTGVVPLAGLGTRMLPITKSLAKGMLPVIDKPVVQYIADEAAAAGLTGLVLVTGDDQAAFERHFGPAPELERILAGRGDSESLTLIKPDPGRPCIAFVRQEVPGGLGDAVLRCAAQVGDEPFAVLLGDNIVPPEYELLPRLIAARQTLGGTVVALAPASAEGTASRTVAACEPADDPALVRITGLAQLPAGEPAETDWIMIGRCVCDPALFGVLRDMASGMPGAPPRNRAGGTAHEQGAELQLSDALAVLATLDRGKGGGVHGLLFEGRRFDTGNKQDYLRTTVELACGRADLAGTFVPWLRGYLARLG